MTRYPQKNLEIQCSAYKASFEKAQNFVKRCVFHNSLKLEKWSFWLEFEQKKGNCQTSKHSITLYFTHFHLFLQSKGRHSKAIFIHCGAVSSKWDLFWRVFIHWVCTKCQPFIQVSGHKNKTSWRVCIPTVHTWNEKWDYFREFSTTVYLKWDNFKGFSPTVKLTKPQGSSAEGPKFKLWVAATVNTVGFGDWLDRSAVCLQFFVCLHLGQLFVYFSVFKPISQLWLDFSAIK